MNKKQAAYDKIWAEVEKLDRQKYGSDGDGEGLFGGRALHCWDHMNNTSTNKIVEAQVHLVQWCSRRKITIYAANRRQ